MALQRSQRNRRQFQRHHRATHRRERMGCGSARPVANSPSLDRKKGGHGNGASQLGVELPELTLVDGQQIPLQTQLFQTSAGTAYGRDAAVVGTTTGMGAVI